MPLLGHGPPIGGQYAAPAVLTLTVLAPTRSTALMYAFCKSAIMETEKTSAGFVERVPTGPVTGQGRRRKTCRSKLPGRRASLGPERLERFLVLIEQPRLDDPVVFDPQEEQVGLLEDAIPAGPFRGGQGGRMHVARQDVDEFRVERPVGELREFLKVREDRRLSPMVSRDRAGSGHVPHRVLGDQLAQRRGILRLERRVETLDESRVRVLEHPHPLT